MIPPTTPAAAVHPISLVVEGGHEVVACELHPLKVAKAKAKADLDDDQAVRAHFRNGAVEFAVRLRALDPTSVSRLQQEVNKLEEALAICRAQLADYPRSCLPLECYFSENLGKLRYELHEAKGLLDCLGEFNTREDTFRDLIHDLAEGYPIEHGSWL